MKGAEALQLLADNDQQMLTDNHEYHEWLDKVETTMKVEQGGKFRAGSFEDDNRAYEPDHEDDPAPQQQLVQLGMLQANTPATLISGASAIATQLADVIESRKLYTKISGKKHVRVEGWTTLGALLGAIPQEESVEDMADGGFRATVTFVRMADGRVISRASSECGMDEDRWASAPRYARRSMAVTRATGKAARLAFSWIMTLAGFEATPAEEMPQNGGNSVPCGKHKGKPWADVSDDYLGWATQAETAPAHLKAGAAAEIKRRVSPIAEGEIGDSDVSF